VIVKSCKQADLASTGPHMLLKHTL